jgi:hypothetical protein
MYYMLINGFTFECSLAMIVEFLETFNPSMRIIISEGLNGEQKSFDTVQDCLNSL